MKTLARTIVVLLLSTTMLSGCVAIPIIAAGSAAALGYGHLKINNAIAGQANKKDKLGEFNYCIKQGNNSLETCVVTTERLFKDLGGTNTREIARQKEFVYKNLSMGYEKALELSKTAK